MNSEKVLSVVVPSYNIEDYIERSIQSFLEIDENYQEMFEVIIVNDGSKDNTVEVAERLIDNHPFDNIKVINKANGGHGSTINRGVLEAKGKYFKVIDGDDWVDKLAFEELLTKLSQIDYDMVITDYTEQYVLDNKVKLVQPIDIEVMNQVQTSIPNHRIPMHSITYKTSILRGNHITLTEGVFYVDIQYTLFPLNHVKKWIYYPLNVYQYLLGRANQSVNINSYIKNVSHHLIVLRSILDFYDTIFTSPILEYVVGQTLKQLIDLQWIISYLSDNNIELLKDTYQVIESSNYKYNLAEARKISKLIYLEQKYPIIKIVSTKVINKKLKSIYGK